MPLVEMDTDGGLRLSSVLTLADLPPPPPPPESALATVLCLLIACCALPAQFAEAMVRARGGRDMMSVTFKG